MKKYKVYVCVPYSHEPNEGHFFVSSVICWAEHEVNAKEKVRGRVNESLLRKLPYNLIAEETE